MILYYTLTFQFIRAFVNDKTCYLITYNKFKKTYNKSPFPSVFANAPLKPLKYPG